MWLMWCDTVQYITCYHAIFHNHWTHWTKENGIYLFWFMITINHLHFSLLFWPPFLLPPGLSPTRTVTLPSVEATGVRKQVSTSPQWWCWCWAYPTPTRVPPPCSPPGWWRTSFMRWGMPCTQCWVALATSMWLVRLQQIYSRFHEKIRCYTTKRHHHVCML